MGLISEGWQVKPKQLILDIHREILVDLFAGGGGMSKSFQQALGRHPDIAVNHNENALSMHRINHPQTRHFVADVFEVDPRTVCEGRPVGHLHLSPDCTHHSQAAGGQPRNEKRRALTWIAIRWVGQVSPRVITLENVKQVTKWGPLIAKRDPLTKRVVTLDKVLDPRTGKMVNRIAEPGEVVPRSKQYLIPDPKRAGKTWNRFISMLKSMGYEVECQSMIASSYGAGTTRDRLYMIARRDNRPIKFPAPTHFKHPKSGQKKQSGAYEHIDFEIESKSIFGRKKPLADATLKRLAKGMMKFVINDPQPFILQVTQSSANGIRRITDPLPTITTAKGGEFALAAPVLVQAGHGEGSGKTKRWSHGSNSIKSPIGAITASGGGHALGTAFLSQMKFDAIGRDLREPMPTITSGGNSKRDAGAAHSLALISANLLELRNNKFASDITDPISTITTSGAHHGLVTYELSHDVVIEKALRVAEFIGQYSAIPAFESMTVEQKLELVSIKVKGLIYVIVDITLRMLKPKELYSAQGFPKDYIFTHGHDGRLFSVAEQVRMVGNSVSPYPGTALIAACHEDDELMLVA